MQLWRIDNDFDKCVRTEVAIINTGVTHELVVVYNTYIQESAGGKIDVFTDLYNE